MTKEDAKKIFKVAVLLYLASFFIMNWNDVSWIFNYKEVAGLVEDFFNPYPSIDASTMNVYFYPNHSLPLQTGQNSAPAPVIKNVKTNYTDEQNTLEVPSLSLSLPIIFATSSDKTAMANYLDQGVVFYPGSVYPGQVGQIIILGHSAPPGWPHIKHDWAFTDIDKLKVGDTISIDLNNKQYNYTVTQTDIIKRGADVPANSSITTNNVLTLISCWPPGKDYQRIAVTAELQNS
jgi:LPXTG-site transpeptidase (sortase) family protein